jgi:hypothetical protein
MKRFLCALVLLGLSLSAFAREPDDYQVTGVVSALEADVITVMKGKEKFEIARDPADKTDVKVGDKVTVHYRMRAASIEVKPAKATKK